MLENQSSFNSQKLSTVHFFPNFTPRTCAACPRAIQPQKSSAVTRKLKAHRWTQENPEELELRPRRILCSRAKLTCDAVHHAVPERPTAPAEHPHPLRVTWTRALGSFSRTSSDGEDRNDRCSRDDRTRGPPMMMLHRILNGWLPLLLLLFGKRRQRCAAVTERWARVFDG